ncbi:lipase family protein [Streptomyces deserti]
MARIVGVHGVGKQRLGAHTLLKDWEPALADGLDRADGPKLASGDLRMAFYGDLFRPAGHTLAVGDPLFTASDVDEGDEGLESELLLEWWAACARTDPAVPPPGADTLTRSPRAVQTALRVLQHSRFFAEVSLRALVFDLKQVHRYLTDDVLRAAARSRVEELIGPDTRVVVAHSLGSVVAYEALCARSEDHQVRTLVTLGSPLGMRMVHDRLRPEPGAWPGTVRWTNVVDEGDVVAAVRDLSLFFGTGVAGKVVHNGSHAHDATRYLTAKETGEAVAEGLA